MHLFSDFQQSRCSLLHHIERVEGMSVMRRYGGRSTYMQFASYMEIYGNMQSVFH